VNPTEERLHDALRAAGETIESVPAFVVPARRFTRRRVAAFVSVAAVIIAGVAFWSGSGDKEPLSTPALAGLAEPGEISVFLCVGKSTSNPACGNQDATEAEKTAIEQKILSFPQVNAVEYESQEEALARLRETFRNTPGLFSATRVGDVPDSFRVRLSDPGLSQPVVAALTGMPGTDQVVDIVRLRHKESVRTP
jgi:cell division protein FtsX